VFGIGAIVAFAIALIMNLADMSHGHLTYVLFVIVGLLCLAVHTVIAWWPHRG
jgi:hypothetical protein